jgi:hypothetical protein
MPATPKLHGPGRPPPARTPPPAGDRRVPPPTDEAQAAARKEIAQLFRADYAAARDRDRQRALAEELYRQATETNDDPTAAYALYVEARDVAAAAGDVEVLEKVLADLGRGYRVDVEEMAERVLIRAAKQPRDPAVGRDLSRTAPVEMLVKAAKQLWDPAVNRDLGRMAVRKADESLRRGDFVAAESLADAAQEMGRRASDGPTVLRATALLKQIHERRRHGGL